MGDAGGGGGAVHRDARCPTSPPDRAVRPGLADGTRLGRCCLPAVVTRAGPGGNRRRCPHEGGGAPTPPPRRQQARGCEPPLDGCGGVRRSPASRPVGQSCVCLGARRCSNGGEAGGGERGGRTGGGGGEVGGGGCGGGGASMAACPPPSWAVPALRGEWLARAAAARRCPRHDGRAAVPVAARAAARGEGADAPRGWPATASGAGGERRRGGWGGFAARRASAAYPPPGGAPARQLRPPSSPPKNRRAASPRPTASQLPCGRQALLRSPALQPLHPRWRGRAAPRRRPTAPTPAQPAHRRAPTGRTGWPTVAAPATC